MRPRVLAVGVDLNLLQTRQALLSWRGYDSAFATPGDIDEALAAGRYDLVILSVMLGAEQRARIQCKLPAGTKVLSLHYLVQPHELFEMVATVLGPQEAYRD
jgi:DNA-binding response OmpR family regulator